MSEQKIKILQVSSYPPPYLGTETRVWFLTQKLRQQGHHCAVLNIGERRKVESETGDYDTVLNGFDFLNKLWRYLYKGYLVHMHMNGDSLKGCALALIAGVTSALFARRLVLTFHAGPKQKYFPKHRNKLLAPMFSASFKLAEVIICNNAEVKNAIKHYAIADEKIQAIPSISTQYVLVSTGVLEPELAYFIRQHSRIFTVSLRFDSRYDIDTLLKAFAILRASNPDVGLIIAGPLAGRDYFDQFLSFVGVYVAGELCRNDFLTLLRNSDVFIRTMIHDGVSASVIEALYFGIPVVACENNMRPPSVLTYPAGDIAKLAYILAQVLDDYDRIKACVKMPVIKDTLQEEINLLKQVCCVFTNTR